MIRTVHTDLRALATTERLRGALEWLTFAPRPRELPPDPRPMVWFFEKNGAYLRVESRLRDDTPQYELVWTGEDGQEHREQFETEDQLLHRYDELTAALHQSGWTGPSTWRI
jgi:hypothetical protein